MYNLRLGTRSENSLAVAHISWLCFIIVYLQGKMLLQLAKEQSARLLKHVVRCYLRLSDNPRWEDRLIPFEEIHPISVPHGVGHWIFLFLSKSLQQFSRCLSRYHVFHRPFPFSANPSLCPAHVNNSIPIFSLDSFVCISSILIHHSCNLPYPVVLKLMQSMLLFFWQPCCCHTYTRHLYIYFFLPCFLSPIASSSCLSTHNIVL